jgi:hypothetical protein
MAIQGPVVVIGGDKDQGLAGALADAGAFPVIVCAGHEASSAIAAAEPGAILLGDPDTSADPALADWLSRTITPALPFTPVLALTDAIPAYREALVQAKDAQPAIVVSALASALRVRSLHAAVLRRTEAARESGQAMPRVPSGDPLSEAHLILAGRGRSYPSLSVSLGQQTRVIGTLTIAAAARHLKTRDIDGLVIGEGFDPRGVQALLSVLADDARFRELPIGMIGVQGDNDWPQLPHLISADATEDLIARIVPLIRLHAFAGRLRVTLQAFDNAAALDPETGLLRHTQFGEALSRLLRDAAIRNQGLALARFVIAPQNDPRRCTDAARLVAKMMRHADIGCRDDDGSILAAFAETDLAEAKLVSKRLANSLRQTLAMPDGKRRRAAPKVILTMRKSTDNLATLMARVSAPARVAAE